MATPDPRLAAQPPDNRPEPPDDAAEPGAADAAPARRGWRSLTRARVAVPACAVLYLVALTLPWFSTPAYDAGFGYQAPASTVNGFDAGMLVVAAALLVLAAVSSLLPSRLTRQLPVPAALVTAGLATLALLLTVPEWLTTFDRGFAPAGLLAVLSAAVACAVALVASIAAVRAWPPAAARSVASTGAADPTGAGLPVEDPVGAQTGAQSAAQPEPAAGRPDAGSADDEQWADPRRRRSDPGATPEPRE
jgi:hypothetical protein